MSPLFLLEKNNFKIFVHDWFFRYEANNNKISTKWLGVSIYSSSTEYSSYTLIAPIHTRTIVCINATKIIIYAHIRTHTKQRLPRYTIQYVCSVYKMYTRNQFSFQFINGALSLKILPCSMHNSREKQNEEKICIPNKKKME